MVLHTGARPIDSFSSDLFGMKPSARRISSLILKPTNRARMVGIIGPWGSGRTSLMNLAIESINEETKIPGHRRAQVFPVFESPRMESIGNLSVALLWHIHRCLPENVYFDEKILYRLGRISVALSIVGYNIGSKENDSGTGGLSSRNLELVSKVLPPEKKSPVSSVFSACEQVEDLTDSFVALGKMICDLCGCETLVIPIDDLDRCTPRQVITLLHTLRYLMASDSFSFVISLDRRMLTKFLSHAYGLSYEPHETSAFIDRIFDEWIDLPAPVLHATIAEIDFPVREGLGDYGRNLKDEFIEAVLHSNITSLLTRANEWIRACNRFSSYLNDSETDPTIFLDKRLLVIRFGWCVLGAGCPEQLSLLLESVSYGKQGLETFIAFCRLPEEQLLSVSPRDIVKYPKRLRDLALDRDSAPIRFLRNVDSSVSNQELGETLLGILHYV